MNFKKVLAGASLIAATIILSMSFGSHSSTAGTAAPDFAYDDQLQTGWGNWSWGGTTKFDSSIAARGSHSIAFSPTTAWSALYLHRATPLVTTNYSSLSFYMQSGSSPSNFVLSVYDQNAKSLKSVKLSSYTPAENSNWSLYTIPLADLNAQNTTISGLSIQDVSGSIQQTIYVDEISFFSNQSATNPVQSTTPAAPVQSSIELETASLSDGSGQVFTDTAASAGKAVLIWSNGSVTATANTPQAASITILAKGDQCNGAPSFDTYLDGTKIGTTSVAATTWTPYTISSTLASGSHELKFVFTNDAATSTCDRNLRLDQLSFNSAPQVAQTKSAVSAATSITSAASQTITDLFVDPADPAKAQASSWAASRPNDARLMSLIAAQPTARWFGEWSGDIRTSVSQYVSSASSTTPVLVAYNIPQRDCGQYSAGGTSSSSAYNTWISGFANGINGHKAIVILEPDSLALNSCLSANDQQTRYQLLNSAVTTLKNAGATVYLDAGHANWIDASTMALRLKQAGISKADGFFLNVSNFSSTTDETTYGTTLSNQVGGKHFVIDTSRNGNGANTEWCNPSGRALGNKPTTNTGNSLIDAYLWVKQPGESDGTCNGGPSAGQWWPDYALSLAKDANW